MENAMTAYLLPAALLLAALVVYFSLRWFRIRRFRNRPRNIPVRNPETLLSLLEKAFPGIPLPAPSPGGERPRDPDATWGWWVRENALADLPLAEGPSPWKGASALHALRRIDRHVFDAIAELSRQRVAAFSELDRPFQWMKQDREYAERMVGAQLRGNGHEVVFPEGVPRKGYRFLVDGKPVLLPEELRFDFLRHMEEYPGLGMITPVDFFDAEDAMLTLDSTPKAHRLTPLTGTGIDPVLLAGKAFGDKAIASPLDGVVGGAVGGVDYHNPVVTLGLSSLREIRLLRKKHTNLLTSAKNIGLDAAGTGVGGFAGAKAGATVGTVVAPGVGTIVGALLGGMGGAYAGRTLTNRIKFAKAEEARKYYVEKAEEFQRRVMDVTIAARKNLEAAIETEQSVLQKRGSLRLDELSALSAHLEAEGRTAYALPSRELDRLFEKALRTLREREHDAAGLLQAIPAGERIFWPIEEAVRLATLRSSLRRDIHDLTRARALILDEESPLESGERTELGFELIAAVGGQGEEIVTHLAHYNGIAASALTTLSSWPPPSLRELGRRRGVALTRLRSRADALRKRTAEQLKGDVTKARRAQNRFARELRKLGLPG
jgi:hypothetical protein